jgi:hypothetical protein
MGEVINLRGRRKQAERAEKQRRAQENCALHGRSKAERKLDDTRRTQADKTLDAHRIEPGDG